MHATDSMLEAGAEYIYGYSREKAIERDEEDKFESCRTHAQRLFDLMMAAQADVTQEQLAKNEPVGNNPLLW